MKPIAQPHLVDALVTPGFINDPFAVYAEMVELAPWRAPTGEIVVSKFDTLHSVLTDPETFGQHLAPWPNFHRLNPPEHTRLRRLVNKAFTPASIRALQGEMDKTSRDLLDDAGSHFDLISDYARHLPAKIIAQIIGVPDDDADLWREWMRGMGAYVWANPFTDAQSDEQLTKNAVAVQTAQADYFAELVKDRQRKRGDDIVSRLIDARDDDDRLDEEEILYLMVLLLQGGLHTTTQQIGNTMLTLLQKPDSMDLLRQQPDLVPAAIEEGLRFVGTLQTEVRVARRDAVIEGVEVFEGEELLTMHGAANRDPRAFEFPQEFDILRSNAGTHLAFGFGIHHCIGAPLARAELNVALRDLVSLPGLRLAAEPVPETFFRVRGWSSIPVETD